MYACKHRREGHCLVVFNKSKPLALFFHSALSRNMMSSTLHKLVRQTQGLVVTSKTYHSD